MSFFEDAVSRHLNKVDLAAGAYVVIDGVRHQVQLPQARAFQETISQALSSRDELVARSPITIAAQQLEDAVHGVLNLEASKLVSPTGKPPIALSMGNGSVRHNGALLDSFNANWMRFRNDAGETIPAYAVMRITGAVFDQHSTTAYGVRNNQNVYLTCAKPSTTFQSWYAVNGADAVTAGNFGSCTQGPAYVLYEGGTPAYGEGWGAKPGSWKLNKNYAGFGFFTLGGNETLRGAVFAKQVPATQLIVKLNASLTPGGSAACSIWRGAGGSEADETGMDLTAYDWMGLSGASGDRAKIDLIDGIWYFGMIGVADPEDEPGPLAGNPWNFPGFDSTKKQALIHDGEGPLEWQTIGPCTP